MRDTHWLISTARQQAWFNDVLEFAMQQGEVLTTEEDTMVLTHDEDDILVAVRFY